MSSEPVKFSRATLVYCTTTVRFGLVPVVVTIAFPRGVSVVDPLAVAFALSVTVVPEMFVITALFGIPEPLKRIPTRMFVVVAPVMVGVPFVRVPENVL